MVTVFYKISRLGAKSGNDTAYSPSTLQHVSQKTHSHNISTKSRLKIKLIHYITDKKGVLSRMLKYLLPQEVNVAP
jgi:hypothetical protein